jgi:radical SAM superfamily enzyme YgiQ (UPF0313 family)
MKPSLILINPWIYDFAAYDLWSKPLGLLYLAGRLRHCGFKVHLIDCLDIHNPRMKSGVFLFPPLRRLYGTGKFWRHEISKPEPLKGIPRPYSRYGLSLRIFEEELNRVPRPAAILVTSLMTYWYPGVTEAISLARKTHPDVPIILGGTYARLCHDHASQNCGADRVLIDSALTPLLNALNGYGVPLPDPLPDPGHPPYPAFDLLSRIDYICLQTSTGCPYACRYCASHFLNPSLMRRDPAEVLDEIIFWHKGFGIQDFAFYDDALLAKSATHLAVLLDALARLHLDLRFHTPNALHLRGITPDIAGLMHRTGFRTIRLGLESADFSLHRDLDNKIAEGDFEKAVHHLLKAGFSNNQIGAYILIGLPGQSVDSVIQTIDLVAKTGALPFLSEYSPIPHTALWEDAVNHSEYDLASEPLFHNNTLLPCWDKDQRKELPGLKMRVREVRQRFS